MGKWKQRLTILGLSASLAGTTFLPSLAAAENISIKSASKPVIDFREQKESLQTKLGTDTQAYSKDTLIIKYNKSISSLEHKKAGATIIKSVPALKYVVVKLNKNTKMEDALKVYQNTENVVSVSPSAILTTLSTNDPKVGEQYQIPLLQLEKAQKLAGKNPVTVAVIDQGVYSNHPEFSGQLLPSYNAVNPLNQGIPDFHGTHVAGIIAAKKNNGIGGYGVNPNAKILPIDVFNRDMGASDYTIADAILYAVNHGAKVINMSLGSSMFSPIMEDAIKVALSKNVTIVAAAGNTGDDTLSYPAGYEGVISVGSTNKNNELSYYSTYGPSVDLVAPGEDVYAPIYDYEKKTSFERLSGTSMATPMVAGVASLLLTKYPKLTPTEIDYILKHSAKDLGSKDYDTKFGHGLVDPVAALSFDIKKIPASVKKLATEKEILSVAEEIEFTNDRFTKEGKVTKANEVQWLKFKVKKGEYYQTVLNGSNQYDYMLDVNLYSSDGAFSYNVNQVKEGKTEGKLVKAPFDGVMAIGVKDANGNYDDSGKGKSKYKLLIEKASEVKEDGKDVEHIESVSKLPYTMDGLTFTGEDGDEDYWKVKVEEPSLIKIKTTAVPGIDQTIKIFPAELLMPPTAPDGGGDKGETTTQGNLPSPEPMFLGNKYGTSEAEELVFEAVPGMEYIVVVTNKQNPDFYWYPERSANLKVEPALTPYSVKIESRLTTMDEDGLPLMNVEPEKMMMDGQIGAKEYSALKIEQQEENSASAEMTEEERMIQSVLDNSRPYEIGGYGEGFLQGMGDEDWFVVAPNETAIYQFNLSGSGLDWPMVEINRVSEYEDENGKIYKYLEPVAYNYEFGWYGDIMKPNFYAGLKKGEKYYIKVQPANGSLSFDSYKFSSKLVIKNPQDKYEDNDKLEKVKDLPSSSITANFALPADQDVFYYKASMDGLMGISMERASLSKEEASKYPKDLLGPLYLFGAVAEDSNRNRKLDDEEMDKIIYIQNGILSGRSTGAFNAKKGKGYFLLTTGFVDSTVPFSMMPYKLTLENANRKDEDSSNVVKNNKPSKPLNFKKVKNELTATGYFNPGVPYGDEDWYVLKLDKNTNGKIVLSAKSEIDGEISIYQNGKLIKTSNIYAAGDAEVLNFTLSKGTYHIKVKDIYGNASVSPYTLSVQ